MSFVFGCVPAMVQQNISEINPMLQRLASEGLQMDPTESSTEPREDGEMDRSAACAGRNPSVNNYWIAKSECEKMGQNGRAA